MFYSKLADIYERLESTSARLKKTEIITRILKEADKDLPKVVLLLQGRVFPSWDEREMGIADLLMIKVISTSTGYSVADIKKQFSRLGDFGLIIEKLMNKKKQRTLFQKQLTVEKVFSNLQKIADITGSGSQERKFSMISELLSSAKPVEAKYIVRTVLGDLRIGVAEGIIRDAIASAFLPEEKEAVDAVEWAWFIRPDYGEVALIARDGGLKALRNVKLKVGKPYHVLLAERSPSLEEAMNAYQNVAIEQKYDGARICIHKDGEKIYLFTRRLENVTAQFPEVVEWSKTCLLAKKCIVEGEMLAIDKKTGKPIPFQMLSQRVKRKYDIEKIASKIPVQVNLFDITYLNGQEMFERPLKERWEHLKGVVKNRPGRFQLAKHLVTKDLKKAKEFYKEALKDGQEGVMVKNLDAEYQPGRRVGYWLKVKPIMETLDLAITGATWGTGKRTGWLGSFTLGCRDPKTGEFLECGMLGTGIKEKSEGVSFEELTKLLKPHIVSREGNTVKVKPIIVIEVAYEEIQKSPTYSSGFALRFPRALRMRVDKGPEDADSIKRVEQLFNAQKGKKQINLSRTG